MKGVCNSQEMRQFYDELILLKWVERLSPGALVSSTNKTDRHNTNWNIVQSGIKHHKPTKPIKYRKQI
jgi:hypothetical protein